MTSVPDWNDGKVGSLELADEHLGDRVRLALMRQVVRMYEANRRQGTVSTKTRGETAYSERKPYKQKGTGNARRGDRNSPLLRGGGVIFGPRPRDFGFDVPRRALRAALRSALLGKLRDGEVQHLHRKGFEAPSTKRAAQVLRDLGLEGSAAVVVPQDDPLLWQSFRNIPRVHVVRASDLNTYDVLWHRNVLFVDDAWDVLKARLARRSSRKAALAASASGAEEQA